MIRAVRTKKLIPAPRVADRVKGVIMLHKVNIAIAASVSILLLVCAMTGCSSRTAKISDLPPGADHPQDYEKIMVSPSTALTLETDSPLYHTLYSGNIGGSTDTKWCSVDPSIGKLRIGRVHNGEYHAGWAYFMPDMIDCYDKSGHLVATVPLYACDSTGKITKIIDPSEIPGILMFDFSVSPDGRYVIIYQADNTGEVTSLRLWSVEQKKLVATLWGTATKGTCWDLPDVNGAWHETPGETGGKLATYEYIATAVSDDLPMNVQYYSIIKFDASLTGIAKVDYPLPKNVKFQTKDLQMLDSSTETAAYDDYPNFYDYGDSLFAFDKAQTPTHLYLYNVRTCTKTCAATLPACHFLAQWVGSGMLKYNVCSDPKIRPEVQKTADPRKFVTKSMSDLLP